MEQWQLNPEGERLLNATWTARELVDKTINTERTPDAITLTGENFRIAFSTADGEMTELLYNGKNLIKEGLQPNFWRDEFQPFAYFATAVALVLADTTCKYDNIHTAQSSSPWRQIFR